MDNMPDTRIRETRIDDSAGGPAAKIASLLPLWHSRLSRHDLSLLVDILDCVNDSVAAFDTELRLLVCNRAFERRFAIAYGTHLTAGMSLEKAVSNDPVEHAAMLALWRRALSGESFTVIRQYGELDRTLEVSYDALRGEQDEIIGIVQVGRDVTERVEAERGREEALRKFSDMRRLFDLSTDMIGIAGFDGYMKTINPAWTRISGYTEEEILSRPFLSLMHPDDGSDVFANATRIAPDGDVCDFSFECRFRCKSGDDRWLSWSGMADPRDGLIYCVARDVTQTRAAQEALLESRQMMQKVADTSPMLLYIFNLVSDRYEYVNDEHLRVLGYSPEEIYAIGFAALKRVVHADDWHVLMEARRKLETLSDGEYVDMEYRIRAVDGKYRWLHGRETVFSRLSDGAPAQILGSTLDITDRKSAEIELRTSEARFRAHYLGFPVPTYTWEWRGDDFYLIDFNEAAADITGGRVAAYLGVPSHTLYADSPDIVADIARCHREQKAVHRQMRYQMRTTAATHDFDVAYVYVPHDVVVVHTRDITDEKAAQQGLQRSEQRFQAFMDNGAFFAWITDGNGRLYYVNTPCARFWHSSPERLVGSMCSELFQPEHFKVYLDECRQIAATSRAHEKTAFITGPDGVERRLLIGKFPIEDRVAGTLIGAIAIDITERYRLEEQLLQAQKMESLGKLAGGIAHDFNNLLSVVTGYAQLLGLELPADSELHRLVDAITAASNRAAGLTRQLLTFARRQPIKDTPVDPGALIEHMMLMFKPLIREDIQISTNLNRNAGWIRIDPGQMEQIVVNLVVNARDAMPEGGSLTISTMAKTLSEPLTEGSSVVPPGHYTAISVADTGTGMPESVIARIFEPFFTTKPVGHGTGLGLSTVYGIVQQHRGAITVQSEVGHGTTFTIYLPCVDAAHDIDNITAPSELSLSPGVETILVVEDEPDLRQLAVLTLLRNGYHVLQAANGVEAMRLAESHKGAIDLLLTDAIMPEMGGLDLTVRLRAQRPTIRVLIVSGYIGDTTRSVEALPPNVTLLTKPYSATRLLAEVRSVLTAQA